jgi:hypothetical protein
MLLLFLLSFADDDDDEDYDEPGGGNHFLGFMFGNVDDSGDLDADYLDEVVEQFLKWWNILFLLHVFLIKKYHAASSRYTAEYAC